MLVEKSPSLYRGRAQAGFTLLELLVALTLVGLLLALLFGGVRFGVRAWEAGVELSDSSSRTQAAQDVLRRLLETTRPPAESRGTDQGAGAAFSGGASVVRFVAGRPGFAAPQGDYEYRVGVDGGDLVLQWRPWRSDLGVEELPSFTEELLLENVGRISIRYFGRSQEDLVGWHQMWDRSDSLPQLVNIRLTGGSAGPDWADMTVALHQDVSPGGKTRSPEERL